MTREPGDHFDHPARPTVDQPLHGERRSPLKPLLITVAVFAVLALLYWAGTFLIELG